MDIILIEHYFILTKIIIDQMPTIFQKVDPSHTIWALTLYQTTNF